jgi:hypothetical protein
MTGLPLESTFALDDPTSTGLTLALAPAVVDVVALGCPVPVDPVPLDAPLALGIVVVTVLAEGADVVLVPDEAPLGFFFELSHAV